MTNARTIADVIAGRPIVLHSSAHPDLTRLAEQYDVGSNPLSVATMWLVQPLLLGRNVSWCFEHTKQVYREMRFGGEQRAENYVHEHSAIVDRYAREAAVDPALVRSVMHMEVRYNGGEGGHTVPPMNVNYRLWQPLLAEHGITEPMLHTAEGNVRAASFILARLNDSLQPIQGETQREHAARVASLYANTELTLNSRSGVIMYGGKAAEFYAHYNPAADRAYTPPDRGPLVAVVTPNVPNRTHHTLALG